MSSISIPSTRAKTNVTYDIGNLSIYLFLAKALESDHRYQTRVNNLYWNY
jgi:hypothetical protein